MDLAWFDILKSFSPFQAVIVGTFTLTVTHFLLAKQDERIDQRQRHLLGLKDDETFDSKLNRAVTEGFESSVHPLTKAISELSAAVSTLSSEVKGLRVAVANHGERILLLEMELAGISAQVGGSDALESLRARVDRMRQRAGIVVPKPGGEG